MEIDLFEDDLYEDDLYEEDCDDYSNAKVYRIICHNTGLQYIGSSLVFSLKTRLSSHEAMYRYYKSQQIQPTSTRNLNYYTSFKILEGGNYSIHCIEKVIGCKSKNELKLRERFHISINPNCVNKVKRVIVTKEERLQLMRDYYYKHKEALNNKRKELYNMNKEEIAEQRKIYYEKNKDTIKEKKGNITSKKRMKQRKC